MKYVFLPGRREKTRYGLRPMIVVTFEEREIVS
jgi:hypothetical protein